MMKVWMILFCSLLLASAQSVLADSYHHNSELHKIEVTIIDEYGYRLPLYETDGGYRLKKSYMQALDGQEYSIEVRNRTAQRVGFVIAVDGRNIITGQPSYLNHDEKMYILNPWQVSTFRGWRSSKNSINRFYFTDEDDSYSAAFHDRSAMGVIAVAAFYERTPPRSSHQIGNKAKRAPRGGQAARSQAGTGWGDGEYSPTTKVKFVAQSRPFAKHLIKYEWHRRLCELGVIRCYQHHDTISRNRLWDDGQYAPPPPRRSVRVRSY